MKLSRDFENKSRPDYGFITYSKEKEAEIAIREFNSKEYFPIPLKVQYARKISAIINHKKRTEENFLETKRKRDKSYSKHDKDFSADDNLEENHYLDQYNNRGNDNFNNNYNEFNNDNLSVHDNINGFLSISNSKNFHTPLKQSNPNGNNNSKIRKSLGRSNDIEIQNTDFKKNKNKAQKAPFIGQNINRNNNNYNNSNPSSKNIDNNFINLNNPNKIMNTNISYMQIPNQNNFPLVNNNTSIDNNNYKFANRNNLLNNNLSSSSTRNFNMVANSNSNYPNNFNNNLNRKHSNLNGRNSNISNQNYIVSNQNKNLIHNYNSIIANNQSPENANLNNRNNNNNNLNNQAFPIVKNNINSIPNFNLNYTTHNKNSNYPPFQQNVPLNPNILPHGNSICNINKNFRNPNNIPPDFFAHQNLNPQNPLLNNQNAHPINISNSIPNPTHYSPASNSKANYFAIPGFANFLNQNKLHHMNIDEVFHLFTQTNNLINNPHIQNQNRIPNQISINNFGGPNSNSHMPNRK